MNLISGLLKLKKKTKIVILLIGVETFSSASIRDKYVYRLLEICKKMLSDEPSFDSLDDTAYISLSDNYTASYTYFSAISELTDEEFNKMIGGYGKITTNIDNAVKSYHNRIKPLQLLDSKTAKAELYKDDPDDYIEEIGGFAIGLKDLNEFKKNNKNKVNTIINVETPIYLPIYSDDEGVELLKDIMPSGRTSAFDMGGVDYTSVNDLGGYGSIGLIVMGRVNLASILNEYNQGEGAYLLGVNYQVGGFSYKVWLDELADGNHQKLQCMQFDNRRYYFVSNNVEKEYLFELPEYEDTGSALGWFSMFFDSGVYSSMASKVKCLVLPGSYSQNDKTFIYDPQSKNMYYLFMYSDGTSPHLFYSGSFNLSEGYAHTDGEFFRTEGYLGVEHVKIKQRTNVTQVTFTSEFGTGSIESFREFCVSNTEVKNLHKVLKSKTSMKDKIEKIKSVFDVVTTSVKAYKPKTLSLAKEWSDDWYSRKIEILGDYNSTSCLDTVCNEDWWTCAWKFFDKGQRSDYTFNDEEGKNVAADALTGLKDLIFDVGNVIFILVTAFLGVKYIWGGVDSKFSVKNSLMTLVVAAIVFYGWGAVTTILDVPTLLTGTGAANKENIISQIYNTVMYIINFAAVGGIIYIGIKYMLAGAEGKSELKLKGIPVVMGIIMVYGTINLINFILKIVEGFN